MFGKNSMAPFSMPETAKISMLMVILLTFVSSLAMADIGASIPLSRRVLWNNAGYAGPANTKISIPRNVRRLINVKMNGVAGDGVTDDAPRIQTLIDNLDGIPVLTVLYFPAGNYRCSNTIRLRKNNIIAAGDGGSTVFIFDASSGGFEISGMLFEERRSATMSPTDTYTINVSGVSRSTGYVELRVPHGIWQGDHDPEPDASVGQIVKIALSTDSTMTFYDPVDLTFGYASQAGGATASSLEPRMNVGIENLKIISSGVFNDHIVISKAANCWVSGVDSDNPWLNHIQISYSTNIEVRGCYFHEARNVDGGGHGYGVYIGGHSTNCLIEDNIFRRLRHSMIVFGGANRNVLGYNYSGDRKSVNRYPWGSGRYATDGVEPDILFHARLPYANLVEGNVCDYICAENIHGSNGNYNTIFRNKVVSDDGFGSNYGGIRIRLYTTSGFPRYGTYDDPRFNIVGNVLNDPGDLNYSPYKNAGIFEWRNGRYTIPNGDTPLDDASYYYSSKPAFLSEMPTWPFIGVKASAGDVVQTNPAEIRWGRALKTKSLPPLRSLSIPDR